MDIIVSKEAYKHYCSFCFLSASFIQLVATMVLRQLPITSWVTSTSQVFHTCSPLVHEEQRMGSIYSKSSVLETSSATWCSQVAWPSNVRRIWSNVNPDSILFPLLSETLDVCNCKGDCDPRTCHNAVVGAYCDSNNCNIGDSCSNHVQENAALYLCKSKFGIGVAASKLFYPDHILGEYCGIITIQNNKNPYVLQLRSKSIHKKKVFIDALECGSIWRFANHSCNANCRLVEMVNGVNRKIAVVSNIVVPSGVELTVSYGKNLGFVCQCQSHVCSFFFFCLSHAMFCCVSNL